MKQIDRYILREMVAPLIAGCLVFVAVILANTIVKSSAQIFSLSAPWTSTARWLWFRVPVILTFALPVGILVATSLVVIRLGRDNEITALRMGGMSLQRLFLPCYLCGAASGVVALVNNELVAPRAAARANEVLLESILQSGPQAVTNDTAFRSGEDTFCHVSKVDLRESRMYFVLLVRLRQGRPYEALCAPLCVREAGHWVLQNGQHSTFDEAGRLIRVEPFRTYPVAFASDLVEMWEQDKNPEEMTAHELSRRLALLDAAGDKLNAVRFRYYLHTHFAVPFTCLIFALLAAPLSLRFARPGSHPFAGVVITIVVVFFCNGTINWAKTIALSGPGAWFSPGVAAWLHVWVFGALAVWLVGWADR